MRKEAQPSPAIPAHLRTLRSEPLLPLTFPIGNECFHYENSTKSPIPATPHTSDSPSILKARLLAETDIAALRRSQACRPSTLPNSSPERTASFEGKAAAMRLNADLGPSSNAGLRRGRTIDLEATAAAVG